MSRLLLVSGWGRNGTVTKDDEYWTAGVVNAVRIGS